MKLFGWTLNPSDVVSFASLILSIVATILPTIINAVISHRIRKEEFYQKYHAQRIEKYIQSVGMVFGSTEDQNSYAQYGQSYGEMLLYANEELRIELRDLDNLINELRHCNFSDERRSVLDKARKQFASICFILAKKAPRKRHQKNYY